MVDAQIVAAIEAFGLEGAKFAVPHAGYRNVSYAITRGNKRYNLLIHKNEAGVIGRIRRTNMLGTALHQAGLPVRYPLDERILEMRMGTTRYALLYNYLPGTTIPWEAYTMKHIKLLGWAMACLHRAMEPLDASGFPKVYDEYHAILKRINTYFEQASVSRAVQQKLGVSCTASALRRFENFLTACSTLPKQQLLHMDMVRGNVLFGAASPGDTFHINNLALTGVVDFEKAAAGHPLFDVARTLSFLLVDCSTKSQEQIYRYFLNSGYGKRGESPVKPISVKLPHGLECDVLETAIDLFLLYDFYKFLRSNPYESLSNNYHYIRTRDQLLARGILELVS